MQIKFLDLKAQYLTIKNEIDMALAKVIDSTSFILGDAVADFENRFAEYCGTKYCIAVNSGTSALHLILKGLGIGPGDEVITSANTFMATVAAIVESGAKPVLVDIESQTRNIDISKIEKAISSKTRAIMPVHLYGSMVNMTELGKIADKHGLMIIEDAAQAHGAKFYGQPAGSFGIAAGFSFYPGKNLGAYGEGGAIVTSDDHLNETLRKLRDHGSAKKYYHDIFGYNARMDGFQGAVLGVKLKYLDKWNKARNRVAENYYKKLKGLPVIFPEKIEGNYQVYHQLVIEVEARDKLQKFLGERNIPTLIHYPIPIHMQKAFIEAGLTAKALPVTERLAGRILSLPIYPELRDDEIDYICSQISEFFN
ncbi:MAG: DegT/DnrJ/EryC1/StrS family aminotransferase [Candidatus Zixiibacteriota bacterium]